MDSRTVFKIEEEAQAIFQRWESDWDGDAPQYHNTCWIVLNNLPGTLEEIAQASNLSDRTVSQVLNALERGGVSIHRESFRVEATGRPRFFLFSFSPGRHDRIHQEKLWRSHSSRNRLLSIQRSPHINAAPCGEAWQSPIATHQKRTADRRLLAAAQQK